MTSLLINCLGIFHPDGIHLSDMGVDVFHTDVQEAFKTEWVGESDQAIAAIWQEVTTEMNDLHVSTSQKTL